MGIAALELAFTVLTPMFSGGADQAGELRLPSIKGALRFWYRAAHPGFAGEEAKVFGGAGTGQGQSRVLLRLSGEPPRLLQWGDLGVQKYSRGQGRDMRNGLIYLGFPFNMKGNESRSAIAPGHRFVLSCLWRPVRGASDAAERDARRSLLAACWLLGQFGALGMRSRRGFGALALSAWRAIGDGWDDMNQLPLAAAAATPSEAAARLEQGLQTLREWFGLWPAGAGAAHPHLGPQFRYKLLPAASAAGDWGGALASMGAQMQNFRLRRAPDYQMVKDHLLYGQRAGGSALQHTPPRATFGLPLSFRYSSLDRGSAMLLPFDEIDNQTYERHGSLLLLRPAAVGGQLYPLYVRMDGAVPGMDPPAALRGQRRPLYPAGRNAMDEFFNSLSAADR
ncbi:MAG: hypothetical protein JNM98_03465 [Rhodocyclaceae bacterium]|nr:hypothetical protein [Rhodocyclaceae bacterium]